MTADDREAESVGPPPLRGIALPIAVAWVLGVCALHLAVRELGLRLFQ
jgi:hypothetical protein